MFKRTMRQQCRKCKGTGVTNKELKNKDGQTILADPYHSPDDKRRPQYEPCLECDSPGSGMNSYETEKTLSEVMVEGQKVKLSPDELRGRFNDVVA